MRCHHPSTPTTDTNHHVPVNNRPQDACIALEVPDPTLLAPALRKTVAALSAMPAMEAFIAEVREMGAAVMEAMWLRAEVQGVADQGQRSPVSLPPLRCSEGESGRGG